MMKTAINFMNIRRTDRLHLTGRLLLCCVWLHGGSASAGDTASPLDIGVARAFDVRSFGAKGDGKTLDTAAIQKALDECGKSGGTVRFPGGVYLTQPVYLGNATRLQIDPGAKIVGTDDPDDYRDAAQHGAPISTGPFKALINGRGLTNVTITGGGTIDGAGARWWVPAEAARQKTPGYSMPRPRMILLRNCKNLRVENVTLQNSPSYHLVPMECEDVVITNVTITAPAGSPNTDAIDPSVCRNVLITHCRIDVGDDNVAIKSGRPMPGREFACEDITVTDCVFLHGHGVSIGSETSGGVRNVTVRNCTFEGTENGIRIKSQRGKGGLVENILCRDITMKDVDPAVTLTCYYMYSSAKDPVQPAVAKEDAPREAGRGTPVFRNIRIQNLEATCQQSAGLIIGLPESRISDVTFENVHITAAAGGLTIRNARGISFKHSSVVNHDGPPLVLENAEVSGLENAATK